MTGDAGPPPGVVTMMSTAENWLLLFQLGSFHKGLVFMSAHHLQRYAQPVESPIHERQSMKSLLAHLMQAVLYNMAGQARSSKYS